MLNYENLRNKSMPSDFQSCEKPTTGSVKSDFKSVKLTIESVQKRLPEPRST